MLQTTICIDYIFIKGFIFRLLKDFTNIFKYKVFFFMAALCVFLPLVVKILSFDALTAMNKN